MWANMAPILIALGQDEALSRNTQQYLRVLLLAAPGYIGFESLKKYLQCQGMTQTQIYTRTSLYMPLTPASRQESWMRRLTCSSS